MKVYRNRPPAGSRAPSAVTIGNFDGVHLGHQALLRQLVDKSRDLRLRATVLTFDPHPREYFGKQRQAPELIPARIATLRDRVMGLAAANVEQVCIAHFNARFASLNASEFVEKVLIEGLQTHHLIVGDDFRFGARRAGDVALLARYAQGGAFSLEQISTFRTTDYQQRVSSSLVREALHLGELDKVRELTGTGYCLSGHVIHGKKLGRQWHFPTLNIRLPFTRPALSGIFVVKVHGLQPDIVYGVASLGTRPAVESNGAFLLETHCFDYQGDAYGKIVSIEFIKKLRDEANFPSIELMVQQIQRDADQARAHCQTLLQDTL